MRVFSFDERAIDESSPELLLDLSVVGVIIGIVVPKGRSFLKKLGHRNYIEV